MKLLDTWSETACREIARRSSRRGFLASATKLMLGATILPLLPVARSARAGPTPDAISLDADPGDPRSCDYWRYCAFDSYLCSCCGGSHNSCPPGTVPAKISWIGTCRNPADDKNYLISYNDCCGSSSCGRCPCSRHEGSKPIYSVSQSNDVNWCSGTDYSFLPTCSTAVVIGVASD